ncbi:MAG: phosphoribosylanthranilate isomerase [Phycisphaerales bacterium]|nr:phosphoribosylanthranilate isomerase [Phycisphaerales bacterium]
MTARTRVKICGLRSEADVFAAVDAGADAVGFVFVRSSPRYIEPEAAADLVCLLPPLVHAVGVFADEKAAVVCEIAGEACINLVQLHGSEDAACVEMVREAFPVIKGIRYGEEAMRRWSGVESIDMLLVDGSDGGGGATLDWRALAGQRDSIRAPLMLAGGLTRENVGEAIAAVRPYAVDVSSGVEAERGIKNPDAIRRFCDAVRSADATLAG